VLLVLLVCVWGINYSLLKRVFLEIAPMAFNTLRFGLASVALLGGIALARRQYRRGRLSDPTFVTPTPVTLRDRLDLVWLGLVGHCLYQLFWSSALARTSVSNSALIMATTPALVATGGAIIGHERLRVLHWIGLALSLAGVIFVVGSGAALGGATLAGDALMAGAAVCWAIFTIAGSRLMARHSPLYVSGMTTALGTGAYILLALPDLARVSWPAVSALTWGAVAFSGLLSIAASYLIWYAAIQRIGAARTSIYANVVPLVAMVIAAVWLHEPLTLHKIMGAMAVVAGVILTRLARPSAVVPIEE
jgi:drug/metabolite transporter (DMT)-like permease